MFAGGRACKAVWLQATDLAYTPPAARCNIRLLCYMRPRAVVAGVSPTQTGGRASFCLVLARVECRRFKGAPAVRETRDKWYSVSVKAPHVPPVRLYIRALG